MAEEKLDFVRGGMGWRLGVGLWCGGVPNVHGSLGAVVDVEVILEIVVGLRVWGLDGGCGRRRG